MIKRKCFHDLTVSDVLDYPIWRFTDENPNDDLEIEPVNNQSFSNLSGLILAAEVQFSDTSRHLALHQNVSLAGQKVNDHFLSLTISRGARWFPLARYHDLSIESFGPKHLSQFMDKGIRDVFPIKYDLREVVHSNSERLIGFVHEIPLSPLTNDELISLALL